MRTVKRLIGKIPGVPRLYRSLKNMYWSRKRRRLGVEGIFTDIFRKNSWRGRESVSGSGSDIDQTRALIMELPALFRDLGISTILDIPCGDFLWMSKVSLEGIDYTGADIVRELIQRDKDAYGRENVHFRRLNLLGDELPKVDLILCRDCLVHFSFLDIRAALDRICKSGSTYLLATTFVSQKENRDILTGQWRPINLERPPFDLPKPLRRIEEGCIEENGAYGDKSLALWKIEDMEKSMASSS
jgi:SAM-dependent methyltransferase